MLVKFGYTRIGSKIITRIKKKRIRTFYEIENGVKMYLDIANPHTWDLIQGKDPEKKIKEVFLKNINSGDTVIDVGAHIGEFSLIAAKKIGNKGSVIALEPLAENVEWLKNNLLLNNCQNCLVFPVAVGQKSGSMLLYKKNINATMGLLEPVLNLEKLVPSSEVKVMTIDEILDINKIEKVNMLKIDVEGYEYEVLLGCKESFKQKKIKKILCEIHLDYLKKKQITQNIIYSLFRDNGFVVNEIEKDSNTPHILAYQK